MTNRVPVWFDTLHVGDIQVGVDGDLGFEYTDNWIATRGAFPLSVTMPVSAQKIPSDIISPWLANLLPEEEQLSILTRSLGLNQEDSLAVLQEIGGDTAGALSFGAKSDSADWAYTPLAEFYGTRDQETALARHFEDLALRPFLVGEEGVRVSLAGGQRKTALAVLDANGQPVLRLPRERDVLAIPRNGAPSTLILKPDNPILPGIVENENYCLHLARAIGIASSDATIIRAERRKAIAVLRYDRYLTRSGLIQRVHQEDFAQANQFPPGRKYERGTVIGVTLPTLLSTARHISPVDALALLDQLLFNILVANTDAHAKNYSLLLPIGAAPRLAPLYDVSTVLPWPQVNQHLAQTIAGKKRKPGDIAPRHWEDIARAGGFRPADVQSRVVELVDAMVAQRVAVSDSVSAMPASTKGYVEEAARLIEENALRIVGCI
ncbi:MAG: HipA domain-containing protein [Hyphomonadaceae bacterium]|jgi:serine/threonine-protein kinase HipA|nr:HipA domain-containing protein [Aquidulcibacter sp.]